MKKIFIVIIIAFLILNVPVQFGTQLAKAQTVAPNSLSAGGNQSVSTNPLSQSYNPTGNAASISEISSQKNITLYLNPRSDGLHSPSSWQKHLIDNGFSSPLKAHHPVHVKHHFQQSEIVPFVSSLSIPVNSPSQVWRAYGLNSLNCSMTGYQWGDPHLCGYGQVIGIVDWYYDPNIESDLGTFSQYYGLSSCTGANGCLSVLVENGAPTNPNVPDNSPTDIEIALDVEWAHAMAPGAKILLVNTASNNLYDIFGGNGFTGGVNVASQSPGVHQVSMSFGTSEFSSENVFDSKFQVPGVSYFAASGDSGIGTSYPAASPYVVSVGGTNLNFDNVGNLQSETAWSGSGGGFSAHESQPQYQINYGISSNHKRAQPDVAASATNFLVYDSIVVNGQSGWYSVDGTSASTPLWASVVAIANSQHGIPLSSTSFGTLNAIYNAASGNKYSTNFRDITSGNNGNCIICNAVPGYDFVTGLGSPIVNNLDPALNPSTTISVSSSQNPSMYSQSITFTATVSPAIPDGETVTFFDGTTIGTGTTAGSVATFSTSMLAVGSHSITASYPGDTNNSPSTSTALTQTVNQITTTTTVSPSQNPSTSGQQVTFTATVSPNTATGTVQFNDTSTTPPTILGTGTLSSGTATYSTSSLSVGSHNIVASYLGDTNDANSKSSVLTQTVNQLSSTTTVSSSQNPSTFGQSVTFTATISPDIPDGETITFFDGAAQIGTGITSSSKATFSTSSLSVGSHQITSLYSGDTNFLSSTSSAITETVNRPPPPAVPTGVTATAKSSSSITISWTAPAGATWYNVFSSTSPTGPFVNFVGTTATPLTNTGLSAGTTYYYEVRAWNTGGWSALSSPPVSATTLPLPPAVPTGVTATAKSSSSITISWTAPAGATWYNVFSSTSPTGPFVNFVGTTATPLTNTGLSAGTTYYYEVRAWNTGGWSALSSPPVSATTP